MKNGLKINVKSWFHELINTFQFKRLDVGNGMIPGTLTPPDKINGDTAGHQQQTQQQHHWPSPLAITTMAGPMQTPPSSPPMAVERFG